MEKIVLFSSMDAALAARKRMARACDPEVFATTYSTPRAWLGELWEAYGDSRRIAARFERSVALFFALEAQGDALWASQGTWRLAMRLIDGGLGTVELDAALSGAASAEALPAGCEALLNCVRAYEGILLRAGLIDEGRAWRVLSEEQVLLPECEVVLQDVRPACALEEFLVSQNATVREESAFSGEIARAPEGIAVRFAFPSGRYAEPALLAEFISNVPACETVGIASRNPRALYEAIAPALCSLGISVACRASIPFAATDFGRAFECAASLCSADCVDVAAAADFALNPFSRMGKRAAFDFAATIRGNRLIDKEASLALLREESRAFEYFEDLVESPEAVAIAGVFEDAARSIGAGREAYTKEQLSAIGTLRDVFGAACAMDAEQSVCVAALECASVNVSRQAEEGSPRVVIMSQAQLAACEPRSFDHVVLTDMTSVAYPLKETHDIAVEILDALGIGRGPEALLRAREAFSGCVRAAGASVLIERCLNDENAAPTYPAAVVQEFVDCYRADTTNPDDIDNPFSLPEALQVGMLQRGEEALYENASVRDVRQEVCARVEAPNMGRVSEPYRSALVLPRRGKGGVVVSEPCFSASQIESYLECPQKWFALRRLRLDELDETFGAKEMGDFSHSVLEDFYRRFQESVGPKVEEGALPAARELMRSVLEDHEAAQYGMKPMSNRLVATTEFERREVADLKRKLVDFLETEAQLLPGFHPAHFEYDIPAASPVAYAGHLLMGTIDRIDVDDRGRAIIVDYKSSLSPEYDLYEGEKQGGAMRHGKVQALIYAQAIRRLLGLDVVGAIYVRYGRTPAASGALDKSIEPLHVPGLKADRCVYKGEFGPAFGDLLDATEERVAKALDQLLAGVVPASPSSDSACSFCPEITCPQRRG